jgi:hypothetical protein
MHMAKKDKADKKADKKVAKAAKAVKKQAVEAMPPVDPNNHNPALTRVLSTSEALNVGISKLTKDLKAAARALSYDEARYLVDAYYTMQDNRIRSAAQYRTLEQAGKPNQVIDWLLEQDSAFEQRIKKILDYYTEDHPVGKWMRGIVGIGPVIAAGLLAHIDINKAPTVGHIWSFAGYDPRTKWEKGQKRPWNADLKRLSFLLGESFVKTKGHENGVFGHLYDRRKAYEIENNERGMYAEQSRIILTEKRIGKDTEAYKHYSVGRLPPGHIHARARRYAVKMFMSELHAFWRRHEGLDVPLPYPIAILGHAHHHQFVPR